MRQPCDVLTVGHLLRADLTTGTEHFDVHDPGRLDDLVARVVLGTAEDVNRAVETAHQAYLASRDVPAGERAALLLAAADVLAGCAEDLAPLLVRGWRIGWSQSCTAV